MLGLPFGLFGVSCGGWNVDVLFLDGGRGEFWDGDRDGIVLTRSFPALFHPPSVLRFIQFLLQ